MPPKRTQATEHAPDIALVLDDDPTTCDVIAELLGDEGFRVYQTGSSAVGLRLARQYLPRVVVLDLLPDDQRSSIDVLSDLKENAKTQDIRVIVISGSARHAGDRLDSADGVLVKPFAISELLALVGGSSPRDREERA